MDEGGRARSPIEDEFLSKMKALIYSIAVTKRARFMKLKVYFSASLKIIINILILLFCFCERSPRRSSDSSGSCYIYRDVREASSLLDIYVKTKCS